MISKRLEAIVSATVVTMATILVLGSPPLWAAPSGTTVDEDVREVPEVVTWLVELLLFDTSVTRYDAVWQQDSCTQDPDGAQCASTADPVPVPTGRTSERRPRFSLCGFIEGFGCSAPPGR